MRGVAPFSAIVLLAGTYRHHTATLLTNLVKPAIACIGKFTVYNNSSLVDRYIGLMNPARQLDMFAKASNVYPSPDVAVFTQCVSFLTLDICFTQVDVCLGAGVHDVNYIQDIFWQEVFI